MSRKRAIAGYGLAGLSALALAGCTAIPQPEAAPPRTEPARPAPPPTPVQAPAKPWDERALDSGAWRYDAASRTASFVATGGAAPLVSLTCSGGGIRLSANLAAPGQAVDADLRTSAGTDRLRLENGGATLPARDPRLDRIAFSRGRFALEASNGRALTLPVQAEIGRVIEDCR
jgi:hypothetical protein